METARVFNIERFATEDGPGIRTVVFLKGCALRCKWCANPESQLFEKQIMFNANICVNCGKCLNTCPRNAIENADRYGFITTGDCDQCETCIDNCYMGARSLMGVDYTLNELIEELLKDDQYYKMSSGGITFSGGEPLFYARYIAEAAEELHRHGISVLVETCGHVDLEQFITVYRHVDIFYYDIKHIDSQRHKELTGSGNERILENLRWLSQNFKGSISVRYPYIPTCNTDPEDIKSFLDFVQKLETVREVWFLPYHRLGIPKYQGLGRKYGMGEMASLKFSDIAYLKDYQQSYGFEIKI